jgi:hypothetical protein
MEMFKTTLQCVDFLGADGKPIPGLVSVRNTDTTTLRIDEQAAIFDAKLFENIDFVFFRRFADGRSSQIAAYVVDNSDERLDEKSLSELHLKVWLHGTAPLLYVAWPSRIDILTCVRGPDFWKNQQCRYNPAKRFEVEALKITSAISDALQKFSAFRLADGTFCPE